MSIQEKMLNDVEKDHDIVEVALYLSKKSNQEYDLFDMLKLATFLMEEKQIPKENILNAELDKSIVQYLRFYAMRKGSVKNKAEPEKDVELNAKKRHLDKNEVKRIFLCILSSCIIAGSVFSMIGFGISDNKKNAEVSQYIGISASGNPDFNGNLVKKNTYHVPNTTDTFAYYNDQIANDIIKVCSEKPELFYVCLMNTYENMNFNRLANMDSVIGYLKNMSQQEASLLWMYSEVQNCRTFLDFVANQVSFNPESSEYQFLKNDIEQYYAMRQSGIPNTFETLPKDSQKRIEKLLKSYLENKNSVYDAALDTLKNMASDVGRGG